MLFRDTSVAFTGAHRARPARTTSGGRLRHGVGGISAGSRGDTRAGCARAAYRIPRCGIDDTLARGEWPRALAPALRRSRPYTAAEPLPYCDLLIARARRVCSLALAERPGDRSARPGSRGCAMKPIACAGRSAGRIQPERRRAATEKPRLGPLRAFLREPGQVTVSRMFAGRPAARDAETRRRARAFRS